MNLTSSIHQPMIISLLIEIPNVVLELPQQIYPTKFHNFFKMNDHGEQTKIFVKFMFVIFIAFATQKPSTDVLRYSFVTSITPIPHSLKPLPMCLKISSVVKPPGGTPILGHIRDVRPEWVTFPGRKPADGCEFLTKNLRMGVNYSPKTCGWVIILI